MTGFNGNNALHFAALNERKGIVEILIRSGIDLSVPNDSGLLPIELCKSPDVAELFLRDRSAIFSPIAQTRALLSDYIEQIGGGGFFLLSTSIVMLKDRHCYLWCCK